MATPSFTTDLTTLNDAEASETLYEMTGYTQGGTPVAQDPVYPIQGTYCFVANQKNKTGLQSIAFDYGSGVTINTGECIFVWQVMLAGDAIESFTNGGYRMLAGDDATNFKGWKTGGNDFARNPYGGWQNVAVDPTFTPDYTGGSQTTWQYFASGINMTKTIQKGDLHGMDVTRVGRGEFIVSGGSPGGGDGYCTFAGMAAANDGQTARWGLFQEQAGGYLWKGLMSIGHTDNQPPASATFIDSNVNVNIDITPRTYAAFNKIEIKNAYTIVDWTGVNFSSLDAAGLSPGWMEVVDNADVTLDTCTFTDMNPSSGTNAFILKSNSTINSTTFRRCGRVLQNGAVFDGCIFEESPASASMYISNLDNIDNCDFTSDGSNHAMVLSPAHAGNSYILTGCTYTGYAATSGSTGNEVIFNDSHGAVTINVAGGDAPTIRNGVDATTSVILAVTHTLTGLVSGSEVTYMLDGSVPSAGGSEVFHVENANTDDGLGNSPPTMKTEYAYNYVSDRTVDIYVHKVEYEWLSLDNIVLDENNATIPIQQQLDRNYNNPT
jgi:hypothetical protein